MRIRLLLCLSGMLAILACTSPAKEPVDQPNVLWIVAEDLSPDLGCYGHPLVKTPNIDALAEKGVRFTRAFTTAPVCAPSRTALATGMYQTSINAHHMRYPDELKNELPQQVIPLNELLRQQGYQTANIKDYPGKGKTDWSFRSEMASYDTDRWDSLNPDQPFFAMVNLRLTHRAFERDSVHPIDPTQVEVPPYYPDHEVSRQDWAAYLETVQLMDGLVGEVLEELQNRNLADNTIVIYFSDHGRPMTRAKNYHYDSGYHIPLIMYCPEGLDWREYMPAGSTDDRMVSSIDISTTTLLLAGGTKPSWMQGRVLFGEQQEAERELIFCASDRIGETFFKTRSVRSSQYKYIRNFNHDFSVNSSATAYRKQMHPIYHVLNIFGEMGQLTPAQQALLDPMPEELLFDVEADPFEINNLVANPAHQPVLEHMRKELADWQSRTNDHGMNPDSEAIVQAFEDYRMQSSTSRAKKIQEAEKAVRIAIETSLKPN